MKKTHSTTLNEYNQSKIVETSNHRLVLKDGYIFDPVEGKQRKATDEEYVRQEMIKTLVTEYGYPLSSMKTEFPIKIGSKTKKVDVAIFPDNSEKKQETIILIIECKKPEIKINDKGDGVGQLISYIAACPAVNFGLWTNGAGLERQTVHKIASNDVRRVDYDIPRHGMARPLDKPPKIEDLVPATSESLKWRFKKCHNIISTSGEDKLTAFWQFLKVIQTKIEDEKEDKEYVDFYATPDEINTLDGQNRILQRINKVYQRLVVPVYGDQLEGKTISIKPSALARIVAELQGLSLLSTAPTVKGAAYEEIVGSNLRGDKGEFFTPRCVVDEAVEMLQISPDDICMDPACGSGGFSVQMLLASTKAIRVKYEKRKGDWGDVIKEEQKWFALNNIISNDISRNLANAARMNMMMNNDGSALTFDQDILEPVYNWTCENSKILREKTGLAEKMVGSHRFFVGNITALCTNPPFGDYIKKTERHVLEQYDLAKDKNSQTCEILFIERCVQLLKPGVGRAAIIVPQSILNNPSLSYVREWINIHTKILAVIELPVETFLISGREGTGTLTAVLILQRREIDEVLTILENKSIDPYPIYMAIAHKIGYDRRGKTIYRQEKDGTDIVHEEKIINPVTKEVVGINKERIIANDLPDIVSDYLNFRDNFSKGKVFFDNTEEVYRVIE